MKSIGPHYYAIDHDRGILVLIGPGKHEFRCGQHDGHGARAPTTAQSGTISLTFSGLTAGTKYLGSAAYSCASGMPNPMIVRVDP